MFYLNRVKLLKKLETKHPEKMNSHQFLSQASLVLWDVSNKEPQEGSAMHGSKPAEWQTRNKMCSYQCLSLVPLFEPDWKWRKSFASWRALLSLPFPSIHSGPALEFWCMGTTCLCSVVMRNRKEKKKSQISLHQTDQNVHLKRARKDDHGQLHLTRRNEARFTIQLNAKWWGSLHSFVCLKSLNSHSMTNIMCRILYHSTTMLRAISRFCCMTHSSAVADVGSAMREHACVHTYQIDKLKKPLRLL